MPAKLKARKSQKLQSRQSNQIMKAPHHKRSGTIDESSSEKDNILQQMPDKTTIFVHRGLTSSMFDRLRELVSR